MAKTNINGRPGGALTPPPQSQMVGTKPIALISEGVLRHLLQDTGGTFRISAPKWPTETETVPLYLAPPPATDHLVGSVPCPCTLIEQDEDTPIGYPSLLCGICEGKGHTTQDQVTALACEMIKIASDVGEPEDPFAAWESVSLIQSQNEQFRKALLSISETEPSGHLDFRSPKHSGYAALEIARAALSAPENGVAVSVSQDGDHSLTSGRGISQVRPPEDNSTVAPSGDPDFREIDAIDVAAANIRADYRAGKISKEQFQKELLIVSRARQQESAALSAPEAEG